MDDRDVEMVAEEVNALSENVSSLLVRMADVEKVNARLEVAALTTARALQEVSRHWDAVYEAMRREEERAGEVAQELEREQYDATPPQGD